MAKKKVKKAKAAANTPVVAPIQAAGAPPAYFPYLITGIFFALSFIGILNHEMWRDEYQAWMVAADAHSIPQLFQNLKYEGNPVLWHAFLFLISAVTDQPFAMQVFHILISTGFIFLINRHAPFSILQKILLTFGYYTFFEYNIISRSYGLGFLLVVLFCVLYPQRQKHLLWMAGILFLLSNCTIFGVILTVSFAFVILLEQLTLRNTKSASRIPMAQVIGFGAIVFLGALLGYLQIKPEPNNSFTTLYMTSYDPARFQWSIGRFLEAYIPIPDFANPHFWNTNLFTSPKGPYRIAFTPFLFLLGILSFMRHRLVLALYIVGSLILVVFFYYTGFIWNRYSGHLFLLLVACQWLVYMDPEKSFSNSWMEKVSRWGRKIRVPYFIFILACNVIGGIGAYILDLGQPFSTSQKAAAYLREHQLTDDLIVGTRDYTISPLASQLGKPIYYADRHEKGTFIIYDEKRQPIYAVKEVVPIFTSFYKQGHKRMIYVKDVPIKMTFDDTGESVLWENAMLTDSLNLRLLTTIPPGIVADETYYIYTVEEMFMQ